MSRTISEIGGGLNFKRKKFVEMIVSMLKGEIEVIIVAHKDRMCRFAFDFVEQLALHKHWTRLPSLIQISLAYLLNCACGAGVFYTINLI